MTSIHTTYFGKETSGVQMLKKIWDISVEKPDTEIKGKIVSDIYGTGGHNVAIPRRRRNKTN